MTKEFPASVNPSTQLLLDEAHLLYAEVMRGHRPPEEVIRTYQRISEELQPSELDLAFAIVDRIQEMGEWVD